MSEKKLLEIAGEVIRGGVDSVQFRHKGSYTQKAYEQALQLSLLCRQSKIPFIINDRPDIALAVQASGVHLGQDDLPILLARHLLGEDAIIGLTAASLEQAVAAEKAGADYIGFGHIFPTTNKKVDTPPKGTLALQEVCQQVRIPVLAIGGIKAYNIESVCSVNPGGIAIISAIAGADNPYLQTVNFITILRSYGIKPRTIER